MINKLQRLLIISRPIFCLPICFIFFGGWLVGQTGWSWFDWLLLIFVAFPMGVIVMGINDISDRYSDSLNARKGKMDGAVVQTHELSLIIYSVIFSIASFSLLSIITRHYMCLIGILGITMFALAYSLKPIRLKSVPGIDSISNGIWIAFVFWLGYYGDTLGLTSHFPSMRLLLMIILTVAAIHALTTLFDMEVDKKAGDKTLAVALGLPATCILASTAFFSSIFISPRANVYVIGYYAVCSMIPLAIIMYPKHVFMRRVTFSTVLMAPLVAVGIALSGY